MEWNDILKDGKKAGSKLGTLSGIAKKVKSTFTKFTNCAKTNPLDVTTQSARKLNQIMMLEAERRKAEAITIVRHNAFR